MTTPITVLRRVMFNLFAWFVVLLIAFPLLWMILTSLKPQSELFLIPPTFFPGEVTFEHYKRLLVETPFLTYMKNSLWLAGATTVVVIIIGTLGAHSLVRFSYPGRERLARMVLFTYLLPSVVLIIPLYLLMIQAGLANTLASLVIAYTTFALPYALWLLRSFMAAIPDDLEAAALVDGATRMRAFIDVILPQACVMNILITSFNIEWSLLMAASVMMSVPLIIVFMFLQRFLTSGFGAGAVKG
jgi:multiple sugar transport system permease protein